MTGPDYDPTLDPSSPYYIERRDTSDTRDQVQTDATQQVDQDIQDSGWLEEFFRRFTRNSEIDQQYNQQLTAQADALANGVNMRQPPSMMCTNYLSYEHSALKPMVTQDVSPEEVGAMSDRYTDAGNAMVKFQTDVAAAINNSQSEWQGQAGDSARQFMANTGNWVGQAGQSSQYAGTQMGLHSAALTEAKNTMPEEKPFNYDAAMQDLSTTTNPLTFATKATSYMNDYRESQAAHEEAARVVGTYDGQLGSASTMPAFAAPPTMSGASGDDSTTGDDGRGVDNSTNADVGMNDRGPTTPNGFDDRLGTGPRDGGVYQGLPDGGGDRTPDGGDDRPPRGPGTPVPPIGPGGPGDGTTPGGYDPTRPATPLPTGPNPGNQGGTGGQPGGVPPMGGMPMGSGGMGGDQERGGRGGGGRAGFGGGGAGGGAGGLGGRGPGGMGGGGAAGAGALAAEHASGRGGAGAAGAAGGRGGAGMGAGGARGQGGEDEEHQRPSYLVEADPDEVFGTSEMTAPPVIGG